MQMRSQRLDVEVHGGSLASPRRVLGLLITPQGSDPSQPLDEALVYLHGFPDMAVHPTTLELTSRMPNKLAQAWLGTPHQAPASHKVKSAAPAASGTEASVAACGAVGFVAFNFSGVPGSDAELSFAHKTISREVQDAVAVCDYVRKNLLRQDDQARLHVVGLSTGAIVASLLRAHAGIASTITAIAGLLDLKQGTTYDFSPEQLQQFQQQGSCWKEFYLPQDCPWPKNAAISLDGVSEAQISKDQAPTEKLYLRLEKPYLDECIDGSLDVRRAVSTKPTGQDAEAIPLLVIHGSADSHVPFANGQELFDGACDPKTFLALANANHFLSNSKHLKKALQAIMAHTH